MVSEHAAKVLVASNRGPVSYTLREDGSLDSKRGGGGLVSGLSAVEDKVWVCAALSDGDREAVRRGVGEPGVRMLDIDASVHADAYNGIANSVLWFVHHMLYQTPVEPVFDAEFRRRWASFEAYNRAFAEALAEEADPDSVVLVQDYHLTLVPGMLRDLRPDLRIGHFSHTPWAPVDYFRLLPDDIGEQVLHGILGADRAAFLTRRWADAFIGCCTEILGGTGGTRIGVHGLGADADFLRRRSREADVDEWMATLREQVGEGRKTIVRVDRTELSKNIVRGLHAYRALLEERPEWRERVVHVAFAYPSRQDLTVYRDYTAEVQRVAEDINATYGTAGWTPVLLHVDDDFARSLAAYRLADVALVNPIRDGMNLVAKEVPVVSDHGCALVLSREAGAYEELGEDAIVVNPYDVSATAAALHEALTMDADERSARTGRLAAAATSLPPQQWFLDQLDALRGRPTA
ncbi:trehalose-6-phosphate synthase [Streptomyces sp. NBC_01754]|uniref:alpha,alpha-trehalose-phosphate synthase (UDP-forming) n=1 Tax=Streptomyces sp. NBC_01754 TaxID=2975930 RepID=UPI002DDA6EAC|nr:trehalose-6-phosphate synthase [Streptomyces sp. NBC_01754]WSC94079.1 trehalose-6-phosphate synthase [Streptomyces sp. NBC_01754]